MNFNKFVLLSGLIVSGVLAKGAFSPVQAAAFQNGSFEQGISSLTDYAFLPAVDSTSITGWTVSAGNIDYIGTYWTAAAGSRNIDLNGISAGTIQQTFDTTPGKFYQVTFALAGNPVGNPFGVDPIKTLTVSAGSSSQGYTFDTTGYTTTNMGWTTKTFEFNATGSTSTLAFISNTSPLGFGPALDNIIVTPIPEGSTLLGLGAIAGLGLMGGLKRKFSSKK
jgi:choice-of-anchor C domain-containing protein